MSKRKKYPKLPNGSGSIKYLGKNRRNPYGVYPPAVLDPDGKPQTMPALAYVNTYEKGVAVLMAYKAGTYTPGMEVALDNCQCLETPSGQIMQRIVSDMNKLRGVSNVQKEKTFAEVYQEFYNWKFNADNSRKYSNSTRKSTEAAFLNAAALHERPFCLINYEELQAVIDTCTLSYASKTIIVLLFNQLYKYAEMRELCEKNLAKYVRINTPDDRIHGRAFSDRELQILWQHQTEDIPEMLLIMCYSGFRISAYRTLKVDLKNQSFTGGVKTKASKNRTVPIHSAILPLVKRRMSRYGCLLPVVPSVFREKMYITLSSLGISEHHPHDCRHTFSALCERYQVRENDRKRMLGHSFQQDITNGVYGHRTLEELRSEIEKITVCC